MKNKIKLFVLVWVLGNVSLFAQSNYTLNQCKELALKNNAKMKKSTLEIEASKETQVIAYTKYFPQVSMSIMGMYAFDYLIKMETQGGNLPVYDGNPANLRTATQFAYMPGSKMELLDNLVVANLTVMQPIYAGGRISTGNELAALAVDINKDKQNIEKYSVSEHTEDLYWKLVSLKEKTVTLDAYMEFLRSLLKDVNSAYSAGLIDKSNVYKVSIKLSELDINKKQLVNGLTLLRESLCQHIGIPFDKNFNPIDTVIEILEPQVYFQEAKSAVPNRYEMNLLEKAERAEKLQSDLKFGEFLPEIGVGIAGMGVNVMNKTNFNAMLIGSIKIPISGWWGEASHTMEERKIKEEIINTTRKETSELLTLQISQSWNSLNESFNNIELGKKMIEEAKENFKIVQSNYNAGVIGLSDLLEAKATLQKAQDQMSEFKTNYRFAITKYLQAVGKY